MQDFDDVDQLMITMEVEDLGNGYSYGVRFEEISSNNVVHLLGNTLSDINYGGDGGSWQRKLNLKLSYEGKKK